MEVLVTAIKQEKCDERCPDGKERSTTVTICRLYDITDTHIHTHTHTHTHTYLYIFNHKDSSRKLLELIDEFSKVAGYKINIKKPVTFLHIKNFQKEKARKQFHLQLCQKEQNTKEYI